MSEKEKPGLGVIAQTGNLLFPRTFRFTLKSELNKELVHFTVKTHFNLKLKILTVVAYEIIYLDDLSRNPTLDYIGLLLKNHADNFTLTTYDGCGQALTEHRFLDAKMVDHDTFFDYASSDVVSHTLVFHYEDHQTSHLANTPSDPIPMGAMGSPKFSLGKSEVS